LLDDRLLGLGMTYGSVIGDLKILQSRFKYIGKVMVDQTGVGEYVVEDMKSGGYLSI